MPIGSLINGYYEGRDLADARKHTKALREAEIQMLPDTIAASRNQVAGQQATLDHTNALRSAELQTLPDRTQAVRSQAQLQTRNNQAGLELADVQQSNASKKLGLEGVGLDAAIQRQPNELLSQANASLIDKMLSDHNLNDLPNVIADSRTKRVFDNTTAQIAGIAKLGDLLKIGDRKKIIGFMNSMRKANPDIGLPDDVHDVSVTDDPDTGDYLFSAMDRKGNPLLQMTATQMHNINNMVRPQTAGSPTTMEKNLDMLTSRFNMSKEDALAYLNTSKTVSREQFIMKGMQDLIAIGKTPTQKDISGFGDLYDGARQTSKSDPAAPSNSTDSINLDPKLKELLGIP